MPEPRTQFGFTRTACDCFECSLNCKVIPGYLVPDDVMPLFQAFNPDQLPFGPWSMKYLVASPGAVVATKGGIRRIYTLVPARKEDGTCKFLAKDGRCLVHAVSPYGCAMFSAHQSKREADTISKAGLVAILHDELASGAYCDLWKQLWEAGKRSPPPEDLRKQLIQLFRETQHADKQESH